MIPKEIIDKLDLKPFDSDSFVYEWKGLLSDDRIVLLKAEENLIRLYVRGKEYYIAVSVSPEMLLDVETKFVKQIIEREWGRTVKKYNKS